MKAITTLAVLGLAFAGERRENPRFRIDHRVINADNNSGVKVVDFNKDFQNANTTQGATEDWMKYVPKEFRHLVNVGTVESKVFTARNNTGTIIIGRDDADDEFGLIDIHNKFTNIDANHNSGMMKILNRDEEDNELAAWNLQETFLHSNQQLGPHTVRTTTRTQTFNAPNNNQGVIITRDDADDEFGLINIHNDIRKINANHNSGMMTILDDADDELGLINIHHEIRNINANHNSGMMTILDDADDEFGLIDIRNDIRNINANHNSGMMTIHADDEDNELAAWNLLETYAQSSQQLGPHTVRTSTKTQTFNAANNNQGIVITRDDADDEFGLINIHNDIRKINANHNSSMMTILDDADDELGLINIHHEIRNINANHNSGMMTILDDADDELAVLGSLIRRDYTN